MHKTELCTLKENLKRARKMLASSPRDQREEREQEVAKLEQAVKRAESNVNRDRREQIEQEALGKASQEEREKRKAGKGAWHMKEGKIQSLSVDNRTFADCITPSS
jgi:ribosomal RNA-processing protein 36